MVKEREAWLASEKLRVIFWIPTFETRRDTLIVLVVLPLTAPRSTAPNITRDEASLPSRSETQYLRASSLSTSLGLK